jgi:hypothetical protein
MVGAGDAHYNRIGSEGFCYIVEGIDENLEWTNGL